MDVFELVLQMNLAAKFGSHAAIELAPAVAVMV